jgi:uncharacterized protein YoxC
VTEEAFRIVISAGVLLATLAFVVQAFAIVACYRAIRKTQEAVSPFLGEAGPVIRKIEPVMDRIGPMLEKAGPAFEKAGAAMEKIGPIAENVTSTLASANRILTDVRPRVGEVSGDIAAMTHAARGHVERFGQLLDTAGERAGERLEQIDQAVVGTVEQVQHVGATVKQAMMRPVREVNGFAAGISAAVSTLIKGRKSSVDAATQDEELFI